MGIRRGADYDQPLLFPPSLEEWVGPEHPARFIREFVEALDLDALGVDWSGGAALGRRAHDGSSLLKVWMYGYFCGVRSTRKLELMCRDNLGAVWLCRMDAPDHNTLWRFFARNKALLGGMFKQSVLVAMKAGMVGVVLHALDGTKIQAQAANASGWHRKRLEEMSRSLDARIEELSGAIEARGEEGSSTLPGSFQDAARLREAVREGLCALEQEGLGHLHPGEPDARVMKLAGHNAFAYNAQAVADAQSRLLVAQDVTQAATDNGQLAPMLNAVREQLGQSAAATVADQGYAAGAGLAAAHAAGHNALVHIPHTPAQARDNPLHACHFVHDEASDEVICPLGERLAYTHTREHKTKGYVLRCYRCANTACPQRSQCSKDPKGRKIELNQYHPLVAQQRAAIHNPDARAMLSKRRGLIEPVFGWIKQAQGFRRFTLRGLQNTKTQWAIICATYNLHILYKAWVKLNKPNTAIPNPA